MNWVSIDLGTCYSSATVLIDGHPEKVRPLDNVYGQYAFPTVAYLAASGQLYVCGEALKWKWQDPSRFIKEFKLDIHQDTIACLDVRYIDIIARILSYIKKSAEYTLGGETIEGVLLTVPVSYDETDPRLEIMKSAAQEAGFTQLEILGEPIAAAVYYHNLQRREIESTTLVYDLGGGTFDPALIRHTASGYIPLGNAEGLPFGGKYFDGLVFRHFQEKCSFAFNQDDAIRFREIEEIHQMCRSMKEQLSVADKVDYPVPYRPGMVYTLTIDEFSELIRPSVIRTFEECSDLIDSAGKQWEDVDRILLVGGSTYIPCIKTFMFKYLEGKNVSDIPILSCKSDENIPYDPLYAISLGGSFYLRDRYEATCREEETTGTPVIPVDRPVAPGTPPPANPAFSPEKLFAYGCPVLPVSPSASFGPLSSPTTLVSDTTDRGGNPSSLSDDRARGLYYKQSAGPSRNWYLAAMYLSRHYRDSRDETVLDALIEIFQYFVDGMEWDDDKTSFTFDTSCALLDDFGPETTDGIYSYLGALQNEYNCVGGKTLYQQCANVYFWIRLTLTMETDLLALFT